MATDQFIANYTELESPAEDAFAVTPHATNELSQVCRALHIGVAGNVKLVTKGGTTVLFKGLQNGQLLPVRASKVLVTSTTATDIVALV